MTIPPRRLLDSPPDAAASEDELLLRRALQAVPEPEPLAEAAVQRIARQVQAAARPWWASRPSLWFLVVAAPLALAGGLSLTGPWSAPPPQSGGAVAPPALPATVELTPRASAPLPAAVEPHSPTGTSTSAPAGPPGIPSKPGSRRTATVAKPGRRTVGAAPPRPTASEAPAVAVLAPAPDPLIEESRLLRAALHQLRSLQDAEAALEVLRQYDERFPRGQLRAEATLATVDSLLLLRRGAEALQRLQGLSASERARLPRGRELRVLELELQAELGQCAQALQRLEHFSEQEPLLAERALFVRATCEARAQRIDRARALYERLLRDYPHGAHADEARRELGKSP